MKRKAEYNLPERRKRYRTAYEEQNKKWMSGFPKDPENFKIIDVAIQPCKVDMATFCGTQSEFQFYVERFYENRNS